MPRVTLVLNGEYYWLRNIKTGKVTIGLCSVNNCYAGTTFKEIGSSFTYPASQYYVLQQIFLPIDLYPEYAAMELELDPDPVELPSTDEEDWDDGEAEQDAYDEDEWDEDEDEWEWDDDGEDE